MAQAIDRSFKIALYLLVLTGFGTLASTGSLDALAVIGVGLALLFRGFQLLTHREFAIPESVTNYLTLIYITVYFADYFLVSRSFLTATVHLVLFLIVVRLFSQQRPRDHYFLATLSFAMVLGAAVLTVDSVFLFSFAIFLLVAVITFILMEMRHSVAEDHTRAQDPRESAPYRQFGYALLASAPTFMLLILAGGSIIFFVLPRVSSRYLTAYSASNDLAIGFSDRVTLGRIGQIQQSTAVVMHIQIKNDDLGMYDLKWRGVALSTFNGQVWSNPSAQTNLPGSGEGTYSLLASSHDAALPATVRSLHYRVLMEPIGTNVFFLTERPQKIQGNYRHVSTDDGGAVYNLDLDHPIGLYEADSELPDPDQSDLHLAGNTVPQGFDQYLRLPDLDLRISRLAEEVTASAPSNFEKAQALENYLRSRYGYTLELPSTSPRDPLAYFLFERKAGHCEYFASAMAVMLRTIGIPSRIITGFRTGEFNDLSGEYVVRASNAHAWVEAYFPGYGWISFDPTPGGALATRSGWSHLLLYFDVASSFWREWVVNYDVGHQRALGHDATQTSRRFLDNLRSWLSRQYDALLNSARKTQHRISESPGHWIAGALGGSVFLVIVLNIRNIRDALRSRFLRQHPDRAPQQSAALWYQRMVRRLARRGWRKTPSQTPRDFVLAIQEPLLQQKVETFTQAYESARFGHSVEDALSLPSLFEEINNTQGS